MEDVRTPIPWSQLWGAIIAATSGALYLWTMAPGPYWLDSGELTAAAHTLGGVHPPGHPVWLVLAKLASLLPLGSVPARVSLLSAALGVGALLTLYALALRALRGTDRADDATLAPAAALGVLALGASHALWFQSIRAEVYTLNLFLCLGALLLALRVGAAPNGTRPGRANAPLVALAVGLGLGNHHLLVVLAGPAVLWALLCHPEGRRWLRPRGLLLLVLVGLWALLPYAILPLRARLEPVMGWGDPTSLGGFLDVVSARVFQSSVDPGAREGVSVVANVGTALGLFGHQLGLPVLLAGLGGLAALTLRSRRVGGALLLLFVGSLLSKALMFLDPENPDDHGYFSGALAALALGAAIAAGWGARALQRRLGTGALVRVATAALVAVLALGGAAWQATRHAQTSDLSRLAGPDLVTEATLESAPPRAVVMPYYYALYFTLRHAQLVEERRPDVDLVQQTFAANIDGGAPYARRVRRESPALAPLLDAFLERSAFPTDELLAMSDARPVLFEPFDDLVVPPAHATSLGLLARAHFAAAPEPDHAQLRAWRANYWSTLTRRLDDEIPRLPHTRTLLLWYANLETGLHLARGDRASARDAAARGLAISPQSRRLRALCAELNCP